MSLSSKRIFVCGIQQESNSFTVGLSTLENYTVYEGEEMLSAQNCTQLRGALTSILEHGFERVCGVYFDASPAAPVSNELMGLFYEKLERSLLLAGEIDGVCLVLHGATVGESCEDVCGEVAAFIRERVGEKTLITASCDLHANITKRFAENVDFVCGYQRYPHLDIYETAVRSVCVLAEAFENPNLKTYYVSIPVIASASAYTTESEGLNELMQKGHNFVKSGVIRDFSVFQVQPWLDVSEMAATVVVIGAEDTETKKVAQLLAFDEFNIRETLQGEPLMRVEEILEIATKNATGKPIVISDSADSPNAGAAGDSAFVLEKMLPYKDKLRMVVAVNDKAGVEKAFQLGVGGVGDFTIGASLCPKLSNPVTVKDATVKCLSDGEFVMYGPQTRGVVRNMGRTALIRTGKLNVVIAERGRYEGDRGFYRIVGIEPELMDVVDIKACTSFRAGYAPIAAAIYNAETPGAASPVLKLLPYEKRPKPLYPFEEISWDMVSQPKRYR